MRFIDLSELVGLVQFEVQKAFDFSYALSQAAVPEADAGSTLHISLEKVELEVPVEFALFAGLRQREPRGEKTASKIRLDDILGRPFNLDTLSANSFEMPKGKVQEKALQVRVVGLEAGHGHPDGQGIGRIKIIAIPILR